GAPVKGGNTWFQPALDLLQNLRRNGTAFDPTLPTLIARAPGRLDVMGGIADYSGADVLELPLACSTWAILLPGAPEGLHVVASLGEGRNESEEVELSSLRAPPGEVRAQFSGAKHWAAYPVGVLYRCLQLGADPARGFRLLIDSTVPEGKGVASSAALEVAT